MTFAMVFPGQGSQSLGMLEVFAAVPAVRDTLAEASEALGQDMAGLIREGPEEALNATVNTQPLMLTADVAIWRAWLAGGGARPQYLAGHSLGEYAALVAAEALSFADALPLVRLRAEAMQDAVPQGEGAMAAVIGADDELIRAACADAAEGEVVEPVNFNAPGQVVIAGATAAVARAVELLKERGAKRVLPLPVSVPSHCALMRPAAERLAAALERVTLRAPAIPVLHNADVASHADPAAIREALTSQLYRPVRWVETVQALRAAGVTAIGECGPGRVLAGLNKRIDNGAQTVSLLEPAQFDVLKALLA